MLSGVAGACAAKSAALSFVSAHGLRSMLASELLMAAVPLLCGRLLAGVPSQVYVASAVKAVCVVVSYA